MARIHELKTYPEFFEQTLDGNKPFEVRVNDRNYKVGDTVILKEWNNLCYSRREIHGRIRFIADERLAGIEKSYVVFSLEIFKVLTHEGDKEQNVTLFTQK